MSTLSLIFTGGAIGAIGAILGAIINASVNYFVNKNKIASDMTTWGNDFSATYAKAIIESPPVARILSRQFSVGLFILKDNDGNTKGKYFLPLHCKLSIGRDELNDIIIEENTASRDHSIIYYNNGVVYYMDIEPRNPSSINNKTVEKNTKHVLKNQDVITVGYSHIQFISLI
ncbi:FHA domain-containing protein [Plesiomonas shigelloides]|uniref:FHA domain-containing protein n=1 Tax=Plesiomonas shigelloides TaxID=703 RepID=UPI0012626789|nr:FHA domain-containing protein [Plesiomonas shigelloides]KAB7704014.1 FHA domain-containing protein [Plesiomonas shigelloides]